jgi:hypothetical protein
MLFFFCYVEKERLLVFITLIFREIYFSLARVICTPVCDLGVNLLQTELTASMNVGSSCMFLLQDIISIGLCSAHMHIDTLVVYCSGPVYG